MKRKQSQYAQRLRELGFRPFTEEETAYLERRTQVRLEQAGIQLHALTRRERRAVEKLLHKRTYTVMSGPPIRMFVQDECGHRWIAGQTIDTNILERLGFTNSVTPETAALVASFPPLDKTAHHS